MRVGNSEISRIKTGATEVGDIPVEIGLGIAGSGHPRVSIFLQNLGPDTVYLGGEDLASENGIKIVPNAYVSLDGSMKIWAVSEGSSEVRIMEGI